MAQALDRISFVCQGCGCKLKSPKSNAGKIARCPTCQTKMRIPVPQHQVETHPGLPTATPAVFGDELSQHYRHTLVNDPDPQRRLDVICTLAEMVRDRGHREALREMLETVQHDSSGEVVIGAAFLVANPPAQWKPLVRESIWNTFLQAGDTNNVHGAPLLRLAFITAFENDVQTLERMVAHRDGENGVVRIEQIASALKAGDYDAFFQLVVWCEGLDAECLPHVFQPLVERTGGGNSFVQRLYHAIGQVRQANGF